MITSIFLVKPCDFYKELSRTIGDQSYRKGETEITIEV